MKEKNSQESSVSEQIRGSNGEPATSSKRVAPANRNVGAKRYTYTSNYKKLKDVPSSNRKTIIAIIIVIILIFAFLAFSCAFALALNGTNTYADGIKIMGVDISRVN